MEEFHTSIFQKTKAKSLRRLLYNLGIFGGVFVIWVLYFLGVPLIGLITAILFSTTLLGVKLYDDRYMGITAYGERKDSLVITEQYLQVGDARLQYADLTNLVIYVEEYLGMPKYIYGIHHGGNNKIEFEHDSKPVAINYIIKNRQDFDRVSRLVDRIEKDPGLKKNLRKL